MSRLPLRAEFADETVESGDHIQPGFWSRPFVQNALPLITSFAIHIGIIGVGLLTYQAVWAITATVSSPPPVIPEAGEADLPATVLPSFGNEGDAPKSIQNVMDVPPTLNGVAASVNLTLPATSSGGAAGEEDPAIAIGAQATFSSGKNGLQGRMGIDSGPEGGGGVAPFGPAPGRGVGSPVFEAVGNARKILYLCDSSGSMMTKFDSLREQLTKAVGALRPIQEFNVIFFSQDFYRALEPRLALALPETKRKAYDFLEKTTAHSTSDPIPGLRAAFASEPQLIYLLTDGDFPNNAAVLEEIRKLNKAGRVKINTIAFMDHGEEYERTLKQIADENGGLFRFVGEGELGK